MKLVNEIVIAEVQANAWIPCRPSAVLNAKAINRIWDKKWYGWWADIKILVHDTIEERKRTNVA